MRKVSVELRLQRFAPVVRLLHFGPLLRARAIERVRLLIELAHARIARDDVGVDLLERGARGRELLTGVAQVLLG